MVARRFWASRKRSFLPRAQILWARAAIWWRMSFCVYFSLRTAAPARAVELVPFLDRDSTAALTGSAFVRPDYSSSARVHRPPKSFM